MGTGNLSSAFRVLAFGGALILVSCIATFGLIGLNQNREDFARKQAPAGGDSVPSGDEETASAVSSVTSAERDRGFFAPAVAGLPPAPRQNFGVSADPYDREVRPTGTGTFSTWDPQPSEDRRLDRIEHQLSQVLRSIDRSNTPAAGDVLARQASSTIPGAVPAALPAAVASVISESVRTAASEFQLRRELSDLRVASEVRLQGLQQQLEGLSGQHRRLMKSLRRRDGTEVTAKTNRAPSLPQDNPSVSFQPTRPTRPEADSVVTSRDEPESPAAEPSSVAAPRSEPPPAPGVTVVSRQPLRIDVRTRSTTIGKLLAEVADATGSDLLIAADLNYEIQAVSLSDISPDVLFDLLCENQDFEIRFDSNRVELRPRQPAERREIVESEAPGAMIDLPVTILPNSASPPAVDVPPVKVESAGTGTSSSPAEKRSDPFSRPSEKSPDPFLSDSIPRSISIPDPTITGSTARPTVPAAPSESHDLRARSGSTKPATLAVPGPARLSPARPLASTPAEPPRRRNNYRLMATVIHLVITNDQAAEPEGISPIRLHRSRRPGHESAARQVADQAMKLGQVTPVTDASVSLVEGQSARLKIGSLCVHCNGEYGVAAGDTLRVTLERSPGEQPQMVVQGLAGSSGEPLSTLRTFTAAARSGQSVLVSESGTTGSVSMHEETSKLARLPLVGRAFQKTKHVRQIAQRLIVLTLVSSEPVSVVRHSSMAVPSPSASAFEVVPAAPPAEFSRDLPSVPMLNLPPPAPPATESASVIQPVTAEMEIPENAVADLLPAPPVEDDSVSPASLFYRLGEKSTAPGLIRQSAVKEAVPASASRQEATPLPEVVEVIRVPRSSRTRIHSRPTAAGETDRMNPSGPNASRPLPRMGAFVSTSLRQRPLTTDSTSGRGETNADLGDTLIFERPVPGDRGE